MYLSEMQNTVWLIICVFNFITFVNADEVLGCGGFLKSHVPIDFSKVEVKLITKQGIVKGKTTPAPNNGYYFVPLYDKGDMLLELSPPPGWSFEPKRIVLAIDGVNDMCSKENDINFVFQGFGITGKVESLGTENDGPEGVTVVLNAPGDTRKTITKKGGLFSFTPVYPGVYTLSISHSRWKILKKSVTVKVAESNTELPIGSLVIQGYAVTGRVRAEEELIKDASIILFSKEQGKNILIDGCNKELPRSLKFENEALCYVTANKDGHFTFESIPNGKYYIICQYRNQNIHFKPERIEFTVNHDSLELSESFEIFGFSIPGKVLRRKGTPIANAKIFLNGKEVTKTDTNGFYKIEKMETGTYKLRVEADDLIFEEIVIKLNPNLQEIPTMLPSAFKICGLVLSDQPQIVTFSKVGSSKFIQTQTGDDSTFCQYLSPGKYEVEVKVNDEDKAKGLLFFPLTQTVTVTSEKIPDVIFSQLKSTITGKVKCLRQEDCEGLIIKLKIGNEEVLLTVKDGEYSVSDMFPGSYEISVLSNKFCWNLIEQTVNINAATVEVPPFIQQGYIVNFVSSHSTQLHFKLEYESQISDIYIPKGRSTFCLEKPGQYLFQLEGCHLYNPKSIVYRTDSEVNELLLTAQKHILKLGIQTDSDHGNIQMTIKIGTDQSERTLTYNKGLYELEIMLEPDETAVIVPKSDILFFTPPILSVDGGEDCVNLGVKFVAEKGRVFEGKIIPALEGVTVTVESTDSESLVAESDKHGHFKFRPLDNNKEYKIYAKKDSYLLTGPDDNGNFLARKLAEVIVEVSDGSDGSPLPGVLLSLSGSDSYRKNLQSGEDGKISFHSLNPSEYFLRPMMKEYEFEPNAKMILVEEGDTVNIRLIGKRIAYSAFGKIVSLNGEPEDNVVVVASGKDNCSQYSEETTCESTGQFRIRGLQPYCSYQITVKGNNGDKNIVERSSPKFIEITNVSEDVKDLKIIIFREASNMNLMVKVYAEKVEHYKTLRIKVMREMVPALIYSIKLDSSLARLQRINNKGVLVHLPPMPLDHRIYSIQLESYSQQNIKWQPEVHYFEANSTFKHFELNFNMTSSVSVQHIKQTSIWSIIFIFAILCAVYNIELIANVVKENMANVNISALKNVISNPGSSQKKDYYDDAQIDQIVQSIDNPKKKLKPKRI